MTRPVVVERRTLLPVGADAAWAWHARPGALERLLPPWHEVRVVARSGGLQEGSQVTLLIHLGPLAVTWVAEHREVEPGRGFTDVLVRGPFDRWRHEHRFESLSPGSCELAERIECIPPLGATGIFLAESVVRREAERLLAWRHAVLAADLAAHAAAGPRRLHVAVTGSSGLLGRSLIPFLTAGGHRVTRLVRRAPGGGPGEVRWDPAGDGLEPAALAGVDAVVHLAGENVAGGRWTEARKRRIRESRVGGTRKLAESLARAAERPPALVAASAVGVYGDRGDEVLTEPSPPGSGFLAEVCREWEEASAPAQAAGVRVTHLRFGIVLTPAGGALERMLPPFRLGLGGPLAGGRHWMSWISIDDAVQVIHFALGNEGLTGPANAVAPEPVTNAEFTRALGRTLGRPTRFPVPAAALRLLFGELADQALLGSQRAVPARLVDLGYRFRHPTIDAALAHVLGRIA